MPQPQSKQEALEEARVAVAQVAGGLEQVTTVRNRAIKHAHAQGASLREIAQAVGLSKDTVSRIIDGK